MRRNSDRRTSSLKMNLQCSAQSKGLWRVFSLAGIITIEAIIIDFNGKFKRAG